MVAAPKRLVVLAPNWLGDAVMALPLLADLHRAWPLTQIVVAARRPVAPLYAMVPGVADTVVLEGGGGREALRRIRTNVARLAEGGFDAALLLPNSFLTAWLVWRAGIAERWGIARDWRGRLLTRAMRRPQDYDHQVEYYQTLGASLGLPVGEAFASVTVSASARDAARQLLATHGIGDATRYVVFAPGAAYGSAKQWLPQRFAELARLFDTRGAITVLVGAKADAAACGDVKQLAPAVDLCGQTDLPTLAAVLSRADAVVANDSGAMHLAAAVGARVIAVFGPTNEQKTSPLRAGPHAPPPAIVSADVWCRPCMLRECPIDHRCMTRVSAEQVLTAVASADADYADGLSADCADNTD